MTRTSYANKVNSGWTSSSIGYPSVYDNDSVIADYLKSSSFWLRPAGREHEALSYALFASSSGYIDLDYVYSIHGIRPAFNFSPSNVIYATAANVLSNGATFASVNSVAGDKPAYKVYIKSSAYKNYSLGTYTDMPKLTTGGSTVKIEKTGQTGSAVFLLADTSGNGEVKYQATATFTDGVASATLPSGVKASDYVVTVLFLDGNARGGAQSETVMASYTGITVPEDKADTNIKYYTGGDLDFKLSYVDGDLLDITVTYAGLNNATTLPTSSSTVISNGELTLIAREVGKYTVKIKPKTGKSWIDGTDTEKEYVFYIKHKVTEPTFSDDPDATITENGTKITKPYNKDGHSLALTYDKDLINILDAAVVDIELDDTSSPPVFKVTKAKTYTIYAELKDKTLMEWTTEGDTENKSLTVVIGKLKIAKPELADKSTTSKTYISQSSPVSFAMTNMSGYTNGDVTIIPPASKTGITIDSIGIKVTNVDNYVFTIALVDSANTEWTDGGVGSYAVTVSVTRKEIEIPEFISGAGIKTYNGKDQTFSLTWDSTVVDIKDESNNIVTSIVKKNADEYTYTMHLKDTANTQWKDTDADITAKDLKFTINKKTLTLTIDCSVSGATPMWEMGTKDVFFTVVATNVETNDKVYLKGYVENSGKKLYDFDAIDHTVDNALKVTIPDYLIPGGYVFGIELPDGEENNGNYQLPTATSSYRKNFTIKGQGLSLTEDNMPWRCKFVDKGGLEIPVDIMGEGYVTGKAKVTYNGCVYEFYVDTDVLAALGAQIDTSKGTNGISGDTVWTNATNTSKTITIYWKPADGYEGNGGSYTLTYDIEKAKYDLTTAKWDYTNPQEYDPLQYRTVQIIGLPVGLTIESSDYSENRYRSAGRYTAKVEGIHNSNNNYYTPSFSDKTTYIYNNEETDGEFPWSLDWQIAPKKLTLSWAEKTAKITTSFTIS